MLNNLSIINSYKCLFLINLITKSIDTVFIINSGISGPDINDNGNNKSNGNKK